jgi:cytochrome c peroxidase
VANFAAYYGTDLNGSVGIPFFWDNRAPTASAQNIGSMTNPLEMNMKEHEIVGAVKQQDYYKPLFRKAFGSEEVTSDKVSRAIASFVNAMGSYRSRFDKAANAVAASSNWVDYEAPFSQLSAAENRGKTLYNTNCASCHTASFGRPSLFLANNGLDDVIVDKGVGDITKNQSEMGTFKVPTLRNIAITAPYMHDGRFASLEQVVEHYSTGIKNSPTLSNTLKSNGAPMKFNFSASEKEDLIAFLNTLTDDEFRADKRFSDPFK